MIDQRLIQIIQHRTLLQSQRLGHRQNALDETATGSAMATKGVFPPQHPRTQQTLDMVVGRLDTFLIQKSPHRRFRRQQVRAKGRRLGVGECAPSANQSRNRSRSGSNSNCKADRLPPPRNRCHSLNKMRTAVRPNFHLFPRGRAVGLLVSSYNQPGHRPIPGPADGQTWPFVHQKVSRPSATPLFLLQTLAKELAPLPALINPATVVAHEAKLRLYPVKLGGHMADTFSTPEPRDTSQRRATPDAAARTGPAPGRPCPSSLEPSAADGIGEQPDTLAEPKSRRRPADVPRLQQPAKGRRLASKNETPPCPLTPEQRCSFWTPGSAAACRPATSRPWSASASIPCMRGRKNSRPKARPA